MVFEIVSSKISYWKDHFVCVDVCRKLSPFCLQ